MTLLECPNRLEWVFSRPKTYYDCHINHGMRRFRSRRALLATLSLSAVAGCLSEQDETDEEETNEECDIESGRWQGEGEAISTKVELDKDDASQFDREGWRIERECASVAAGAAFDELNDRLEIDIDGKNWARYGSSYGEEGAGAWIFIGYTLDRDGSVYNCPDPDFSVPTARAALPAEVTVILQSEAWDEPYECTHEIQLRTGAEELD